MKRKQSHVINEPEQKENKKLKYDCSKKLEIKDESEDLDFTSDEEESLTSSISSLSLGESDTTRSDEEESIYNPMDVEEFKDILKEENVNQEDLSELNQELDHVYEHLKNKQVTLTKILKSNLQTFEKEKAVELFGILYNTQPHTFDYIQLHKTLSDMLELSSSQARNDDINKKLKELHGKMIMETPTLDKIISAFISESDRMMALEQFNVFYELGLTASGLYSPEWFALRKKINAIIEKPVNLNECDELEKQEKLIKEFDYQETKLKNVILMLNANLKIKKKLYTMYEQMNDDEHDKTKSKLKWLIQLPYNNIVKPTADPFYFTSIYKKLNDKMYGMNEVKEKLLLYINNKINGSGSGHILALKSSPGLGKTRLVQILAEALERPFGKLSFGGVVDSTLIMGHDQGWSGSSPGMIMQILARTKCANPIILLDEIDKLSCTEKGKEVQAALLHLLDPIQSTSFNDAYLNEFPHDISQVWFIATMNSDDRLDPALKDRLQIIDIPFYTKEEMVHIIINHTLPEACIKCGFKNDDLKISQSACYLLLDMIDVKSTGMRLIEKEIYNLVSKISFSHHVKDDLNLSFKIPDFTSLPYTIEKKLIKNLVKKNTLSKEYQFMYT
jgi:hypothetical protein